MSATRQLSDIDATEVITTLIATVGAPVLVDLLRSGAKPGRAEYIPLATRERVRAIIGAKLLTETELELAREELRKR